MEFVVEGKSIHAHKMLLILRCDYFRSMFSEGAWKESKEQLVEITEACMKDKHYYAGILGIDLLPYAIMFRVCVICNMVQRYRNIS